jgi:hypothetical protein
VDHAAAFAHATYVHWLAANSDLQPHTAHCPW